MNLKWIIPAAVAGLGGFALLSSRNDETEPPVYQLLPVGARDIVVSASAAGIVEPVTTVEVKSKASGEIIEVRVETGDVVRAGQLLVKVDPRQPKYALDQAQADLDVARAQLANAESQLRRSEELYKSQSITEQEYETANLQAANAKAQLVRAERSLQEAQIAFEDTDIRAPINGVIIAKNVEVGTVISSSMREVGAGTVLFQMANLDTVQVRALVDETDIGKIQPGMPVTITVDAYPNRPFNGRVLKIEPQATVQQNVTMFPVLARILNEQGLLKPGMNAEVEVHVGSRQGVVAVPNAALRTDRDVASAATVLGLDPERVMQEVAAARRQARGRGDVRAAEATPSDGGRVNTITLQNGRTVTLPPGVTRDQVTPILEKMRGGGGFQALSEGERALMRRLFQAAGGGRPGEQPRARRTSSTEDFFGGDYIVFVMRDGQPRPVPIRTGLTDLDYSEVIRGLEEGDSVLILPSASLLASQQQFQERIQRMQSRSLPGVQRR
ncbi:MAG: efflux RND transporter periplasmic adaptor subunit [Gemmatimonadales bacterium]